MANRLFCVGSVRGLLFYIDSTIFAYAEKKKFTKNQLMLFNGLAMSHWYGKCVVTGNRKSIQYLAEKLGDPINGVYSAIRDVHAMQGALLEAIPRIFVITMDEHESITTIPLSIRSKSVYLCLDDALHWDLNNGCALVGENLDDCKFYKLLGEKFCSEQKINGIRVNLSLEAGGGNTTHITYTECVQSKRIPTVCIVDSDQKYGQYGSCKKMPPRGDTVHLVEKADQKLKGLSKIVPHEFSPLENVHEVENLIPLGVLGELKVIYPSIERGLKILERLKDIQNGEPILYYDFKNGIRYDNDPNCCKYWTEIANTLGEQFLPVPEEQLTTAQKEGKEKMPASPPFFPVLRNHLLDRALHWMEQNPVELDNYLKKYWEQIGKTVLTWGCAMPPQRV